MLVFLLNFSFEKDLKLLDNDHLLSNYIFTFNATVPRIEHGPKMFLLFSPLIDEKISSFLTYLKSWWKVVLVFGKEHANWFKISWVMIGWSWKIKLGKIHFFCQNVNLKCQKCPFSRDWDKNGWSHLVPREK